jgi:hypothetical protein
MIQATRGHVHLLDSIGNTVEGASCPVLTSLENLAGPSAPTGVGKDVEVAHCDSKLNEMISE